MALGSQNRLRRKQFQSEAGGSKWREKVTTIVQAQELLARLTHSDEYTKGKIIELQRYITFKKERNDKTTSVKQFRSLCQNRQ